MSDIMPFSTWVTVLKMLLASMAPCLKKVTNRCFRPKWKAKWPIAFVQRDSCVLWLDHEFREGTCLP